MPRKQSKTRKSSISDYESAGEKETETLIAKIASKGKKSQGTSRKANKMTNRKSVTPNKLRSRSAPAHKTSRELWLNAVKKRTGTLNYTKRTSSTARFKAPMEYWQDSLRKSKFGISTESTGMNTFRGTKIPNANFAFLSTPKFLRQMTGIEKLSRFGDVHAVKTVPGTPAYKTQEEYYDEVLELRKTISHLSHENSTLKTRLRRLEENNLKKEKEIGGLLDPGTDEEIRRTLVDKRSDSLPVIHSLKQKILKLENQLRDKESAYKKLQSDLKTTKIDELKLQLEVHYQEILRLRSMGSTGNSKTQRDVSNATRINTLNETILKLKRSNEQLKRETKTLKEDLNKALDNIEQMKSDRKKEYADMNRRELLGVISRLEKKFSKAEKQIDGGSVSVASADKKHSKFPGKIILHGTLAEKLDMLDEQETHLLEEIEKQKEVIKQLKVINTQCKKKLEESELEIKKLHKKMDDSASLFSTPRSPSQRKADFPSSPRHLPRKSARGAPSKDVEQRGKETPRSKRANKINEDRAAETIQKHWRQHQRQRQGKDIINREKKGQTFNENRAARCIQKEWRKHHQKNLEIDEAALQIQSALQGHRARKNQMMYLKAQQVDSDKTDESSEDAVNLIQSSVRGHWARRNKMKSMNMDSSAEENSDDGDTPSERQRQTVSKLTDKSTFSSQKLNSGDSFSQQNTLPAHTNVHLLSDDDSDDIVFG